VAIRQRPRSTRLLVVTLVSVSLAIITLDYRGGTTGPLASLGRTAKSAIAPMQEAVTNVTRPVANFFIGVANLPSLADDNRRLREELAKARTQLGSAQFEAQLQEELENLVGLRSELHPDGIAALVTASGVSNFDWTVTINRGSNDGVAIDMPVVAGSAEAARLVGRVIDVTADSAEVQLVLDRDSAVWGVIDGSREAGLVWGRGDQDLLMDQVDPDATIDGDENVFTQGYEVNGQRGVYPPGLLIGQVSRVSPEANSLDTPIEIRPAVDFSALNLVLVLQAETDETEETPAS
jgi:rod shape-determining protein MreC